MINCRKRNSYLSREAICSSSWFFCSCAATTTGSGHIWNWNFDFHTRSTGSFVSAVQCPHRLTILPCSPSIFLLEDSLFLFWTNREKDRLFAVMVFRDSSHLTGWMISGCRGVLPFFLFHLNPSACQKKNKIDDDQMPIMNGLFWKKQGQ